MSGRVIWLAACVLLLGLATSPANAADPITEKGTILREWWFVGGDIGIGGGGLDNLKNYANFPDNPDGSEFVTSFEGPEDWRDQYGSRIYGWLHPENTGDYMFWIASDDESELYLSSDADPANAVVIANVAGWTASREWTKYVSQQSQPIRLVGGETYYICAIMKEGGGGDNISVAWQGPDQPDPPVDGEADAIIPGSQLSPFVRVRAYGPNPRNGATHVPVDANLSWLPGSNPASHEVYFGTDPNDLQLVDTKPLGDESYQHPGGFDLGRTYYWQIVEVNEAHPDSPWTGRVWRFTADDDCNGNGIYDVCDVTSGQRLFMAQPPISVGQSSSQDVAVADLDGDGDLDLAVANNRYSIDIVSVLKNNGDGTFAVDAHYTHVDYGRLIRAADLDNDNAIDLIVTTNCPQIAILMNNGNGTFAAPVRLDLAGMPHDIEAEDLNGDGFPDMALAYNDLFLSVFLNDGSGGFLPPTRYDLERSPVSLAVGNLNGDGYPDLAVAQFGEEICILYNNRDGSFDVAMHKHLPLGYRANRESLFMVDLDGDYDLDIAASPAGSSDSRRVSVIMNNGDGSFAETVHYSQGMEGGTLRSACDLDGDGASELILWGSGVLVFANQGDGTFGELIQIQSEVGMSGVSYGDLYNNGALDLIVVGKCEVSPTPPFPPDGYVHLMRNDTIQQFSRDCNGNGIPDECDIADGTSQDINGNGIPDECENDCNGNGIPDRYETSQGITRDINNDGIPDECQFDIAIMPVAVLDNPAQTEEIRAELPESITEMPQQGGTYYVEIWASDIGNMNTGLTGVFVDLSFCAEVNATDIQHGGIFTTFATGTAQSGGVDEFGGSALPSGGGIEPNWVRVGWVEMNVSVPVSSCTISLLPSSSGVAALRRGTIPWENIHLGSLSLRRDCNGNGIPDRDDILAGTSQDCNGNGVPDECDIASGRSQDCNGNGIPDECDIAGGASIDGNVDGIPDECQMDVEIVPVVIAVEPGSMSEVRATRPESLSAVARGTRYYVEVWASDLGPVNSGLTDVYVDISFCDETSATALEHGAIFTASPSGTIQVGGVDEFGGSATPPGAGIEPNWVRVGWIEMIADLEASGCAISVLPSSSGITASARGSIHWALIELGTVDLEITPPPRSYDLEVSGFIDVGDLSFFAGSWQQSVPPAADAHDFDCDCFVGVGDLSWFATGWLKNTDDPTILYSPCPDSGGCGKMASVNGMATKGFTLAQAFKSASIGSADVAFELTVLDTPSVSDTTTDLPTSIGSIGEGQTYYVELWASDVGDISTGLTSAYVDLTFPYGIAGVTSISHGSLFTLFPDGSAGAGVIDELGGSTLSEAIGIAPQWARVAVVEMHADAAQPSVVFSLLPSTTRVAAWGRGPIDWADISLGRASVPPIITGFVRTHHGRGVGGVLVSADNGGGLGVTDSSGYYEVVVPMGWSGTVTPGSAEFSLSFDPDGLSYSNVTNIYDNQDYTARNICDLDDNDQVNTADFAYFADYWLQSGDLPGNFDLQDTVSYPDLDIFIKNWLWTP